ncbi:hypothetical protein LT85_2569 [Collimonas arenae]|uniref:Uncharacterized protein n=1 Tax=Collimonas arenae TaxID=279058 RepID=A0A0A1FFW6_9BURK|nr:hypothetical protein LT85_2569 [Collimonas arenae]
MCLPVIGNVITQAGYYQNGWFFLRIHAYLTLLVAASNLPKKRFHPLSGQLV